VGEFVSPFLGYKWKRKICCLSFLIYIFSRDATEEVNCIPRSGPSRSRDINMALGENQIFQFTKLSMQYFLCITPAMGGRLEKRRKHFKEKKKPLAL